MDAAACAGFGFHPHMAFMSFEDRIGDGEPQPHPFFVASFFGTEVGIEDEGQLLFGDANARIFHRHPDVFASLEGREFPFPELNIICSNAYDSAMAHGFFGIDDDVGERPVGLFRIAVDGPEVFVGRQPRNARENLPAPGSPRPPGFPKWVPSS